MSEQILPITDGHAMQWVDVLPLPENPSSKHWRDCVLDFPLAWSEAEQRIENGLPETVQYLAPAPLTYPPAQVIEMVRKAYREGWVNGKCNMPPDIHELLTTLGINQ